MRGHIEPATSNVLQPNLFLDAATNYTAVFAADAPSCGQYQANREPVCVTFDTSQRGAVMRGNDLRPMRFTEALRAPLRIRAGLLRNLACSGHYLVLSNSAEAPLYPGMPSAAAWLMVWCIHCRFGAGAAPP